MNKRNWGNNAVELQTADKTPSTQLFRIFSHFSYKNYSDFFYVHRNFVFEIQFALAMEFRLNFLIVCGRFLNDPCSNAVWISFKPSTKSMCLCGCVNECSLLMLESFKTETKNGCMRGENNFVLNNSTWITTIVKWIVNFSSEWVVKREIH